MFSVTLIVGGAAGFNGLVLFDNMVTDNGIIINGFNKKAELFTAAEQSVGHVTSIELFNKDGTPVSPNAIKPVAAAVKSGFRVNGTNVAFSAGKAGFASVDVFDMNGKRVATLYRGNLSMGEHSFSLQNIAKGQYVVRVKGAGISASKRILVK